MKLRRIKSNKLPYTVFILGAGFSKQAGGLLIKEIFTQKADLPDKYKYLWARYEAAGKYSTSRDIESFMDYLAGLSFLELGWEINLKDEKKKFRSASQVYSDTIIAVLDILEKAIDRTSAKALPVQYSYFTDKFLRPLCNGDTRTSIISFNWDVVCEQALLSGFSHFHYGSDMIVSENKYAGFRKGIEVYKLHGSTNWLYCEKCKKIYAYKQSLAHNPRSVSIHKCAKCGQKIVRTIVPPTWEKTPYVDQLKSLWKNSWSVLRNNAELVIIIGYSLSQRDLLAQHYIMSALSGNEKLIKVLLVNGISDDGEGFLERFLDKGKFSNTKQTFADFVQSGDIRTVASSLIEKAKAL